MTDPHLDSLVEVYMTSKPCRTLNISLKRAITPREAASIVDALPTITGDMLCISGRMPTWMYGMLVHKYAHTVQVLAVYDPKLHGCIVVSSHSPSVREGDIVCRSSDD